MKKLTLAILTLTAFTAGSLVSFNNSHHNRAPAKIGQLSLSYKTPVRLGGQILTLGTVAEATTVCPVIVDTGACFAYNCGDGSVCHGDCSHVLFCGRGISK